MTPRPEPLHIAIVGAGIVGLAHAVAALDAGHRVTVVEQDSAAVAASVRNFGHASVSVQAGEVSELAVRAREIWLDLVERAGIEARVSGTLAVARSSAETAVLEELAGRDTAMPSELLTGEATGRMLGTAGTAAEPAAGLLLPNDLTVNPRTAVAKIATWVDAHERGEVRFSTTANGVETGRLSTSRGEIRADRIVVAAGHLLGRLLPDTATSGAVRECALQMTRVVAPAGLPFGPAVLTGTSMLRYGAFAGPAADRLRAEIRRDRPELLTIGANVMFTHQQDGTLLVGDSHEHFVSAPPFMRERWSEMLLDEVASVVGLDSGSDFTVLERWQGVYATSATQDLLVASPFDGVSAVAVTTGVGMTVGLALGERVIAGFEP